MLVSFQLADAFTDDIRAAIHSGLTITFVYDVELKRSSALWLDRTIAVDGDYGDRPLRQPDARLSRHADAGRPHRAGRDDRARRGRPRVAHAEFDKLPLFSSATLEPNSEYYVRVRARTTPRNASFVWPWERHDVAGLAKFTFVQ